MKKISSYSLAFLCFGLAIVMFISDQGSSRLAQQKGELLAEEVSNQHLRQDIRGLKRDVYDLYHSPLVMEKYARELYAYSQPEEKVVFFED